MPAENCKLIDPFVLDDLLTHSKRISEQLNALLVAIRQNVLRMSSLTKENIDLYTTTVSKTCSCVDESIKSTYTLMTKCEELSKSIENIKPLKREIIHIENILDKLEYKLRAT